MNGLRVEDTRVAESTPKASQDRQADDSNAPSSPDSDPAAAKQDGAPPKRLTPLQRRWRSLSLFWRRIIIATAILFMSIIIALIVVLVVVLRPGADAEQKRPAIASDGQTDNATASEFSQFPIKLGLLTNFPDPALYYDAPSKIWYAFGTNQAAGILDLDRTSTDLSHLSVGNIQLAKSTDFKTWRLVNDTTDDPLPHAGAWTRPGTTNLTSLPYHDGPKTDHNDTAPGIQAQVTLQVPRANVWAPELLHRPSDGHWVLYYAAAFNGTGERAVHCIGAGQSLSPAGPFEPLDQPIFCPIKAGGTIDPTVFIDQANNNTIYVAYKVGGDVRGHGGECNNMKAPQMDTPIMLQRMKDDGVTIDDSSQAVEILSRIEEDGPLVEAPNLVKAGNYYFLFYSSGCTRYDDYTLRYAYSQSITGPYARAEPALLKTHDYGLTSPGSASIRFAQDVSEEGTTGPSLNSTLGSWKLAFHGRINTTIGGVRALFTTGLEFEGSTVRLVDGSTSVT